MNNLYLEHHGIKGQRWGQRRFQNKDGSLTNAGHQRYDGRGIGSKFKTKISDPDFQRKAATAAKVALALGAAYAAHKFVNNPQAIATGKDAFAKVASKSSSIKTSALNSMMNTTEFKAAKAIGDAAKSGALNNTAGVKATKAVAGATGKVLKKIGSDDTRNIVTGVGVMAGTTAILRNQVKELKENKPDGDRLDRAVKTTQKLTEIGESVNTLARGPKGAATTVTKSQGGKAIGKEVSDRIGAPSKKGIDKSSKEYQNLFKDRDPDTRSTIKSLANAGYDIDQIRKYLMHSAVFIGWRSRLRLNRKHIF